MTKLPYMDSKCDPVNYDQVAKKFMKVSPLSSRSRASRDQWEKKHRDKAAEI